MTLLELAGTPWFWLAALALWVGLRFAMQPSGVRVHPAESFSNLSPGQFAYGGSSATSETEKRIRVWLKEGAGFDVQKPQLALVSPLKLPGSDKYRKLTPDIVIKGGSGRGVTIVEVDPFYYHGEGAASRIYDDLERNAAYAMLGFHVVRIRLGWPDTEPYGPWANLKGSHNVIIDDSDFKPNRDAAILSKTIHRAMQSPPFDPAIVAEDLNMLQRFKNVEGLNRREHNRG